MRGQNLVKVSQTRLNLIDGPATTRVGEIYGDIFVLGKFENNWMVRFREQSHLGT